MAARWSLWRQRQVALGGGGGCALFAAMAGACSRWSLALGRGVGWGVCGGVGDGGFSVIFGRGDLGSHGGAAPWGAVGAGCPRRWCEQGSRQRLGQAVRRGDGVRVVSTTLRVGRVRRRWGRGALEGDVGRALSVLSVLGGGGGRRSRRWLRRVAFGGYGGWVLSVEVGTVFSRLRWGWSGLGGGGGGLYATALGAGCSWRRCGQVVLACGSLPYAVVGAGRSQRQCGWRVLVGGVGRAVSAALGAGRLWRRWGRRFLGGVGGASLY